MTSASTQNTRWSLVQAAKGDTPQGRAALSELCEIYYSPIASQMRRWVRTEEQARDLTQGFFAYVLAGERLEGAAAHKGRFRSYLFGAARHFLMMHERELRAEKRGGLVCEVEADLGESIADEALSPDAEFDRAWACAMLKHTLDRLEAEMQSRGSGSTFSILKPWLAGDASHGDTQLAAESLQVSETAIRVQVSRLRKRMRALLEETITDTLTPSADPQQEMAALLAALR
jgi:RNA polymerase sigma-70 factor (ECF subfamily)